MNAAVIVDTVRTGITPAFQGELRWERPDDLAAHCVDRLLARHPEVDPDDVDDCIVGCAFPEGPQGMNLGRNVAVLSNLGRATAGMTISRYCASGLDAIAAASTRIISGMADVVVVAGVESVSMTMRKVSQHALFNPRIEQRSPGTYLEMNIHDPAVPFWKRAFRSMGETAERLAGRFAIGRQAQDEYACRSQERTAAAQAAGRFDDEIIEVAVDDGQGRPPTTLSSDRCNRPDTTPSVLAELEPAFRPDGSVTAGNASPIADGAASCLVVSERYAKEHALAELGRFCGHVAVGCEPELMGHGPVLAIPKLLRTSGHELRDIEFIEINEAFASQMIHCIDAIGLDPQRVNVNGGAISLGHPFGMTGVRLVGHLLRTLRDRGARRGIVSTCIGGGMGSAALLQV